jgi:hypothetical protein
MSNSTHQFELSENTDIPNLVDEDEFVKICSKLLGFAKKEF